MVWKKPRLKHGAPIRVEFLFLLTVQQPEFLFRVLIGIGTLFRLGTPHSSIPLRITFRSCQGEMQKHGSTCLLRTTMGRQIMSLEKFIPKGAIENFYSA